MKVKELIEQLKQLNPELMVVVRGYEGGVNEVVSYEECNIALDANKGDWYYGRHEVVEFDKFSFSNPVGNHPIVKGVKLIGGSKRE